MSKDRFAPLKDTIVKDVVTVQQTVGAAALKVEQSVKNLFAPETPMMPTASSASKDKERDEDQDRDVDSDSESASLAGANANWEAYYRDHPGEAPENVPPPSDHETPGNKPNERQSPAHARTQNLQVARQTHEANVGSFVERSAAFGKTASSDDILKSFAGPNATPQQLKNLRATLDMLAVSEGTIGRGNNGYNVKVGGDVRQGNEFQGDVVHLKNVNSSAYGRYQLMRVNYYGAHGLATKDGLSDKTSMQYMLHHRYGIDDFSPKAQDAVALEQIRECGAIEDFKNGHVEAGVQKIRHIWASLPGAGYGQHENSLVRVVQAYAKGGGQLIDATDIQLASVAPAHAKYGDLRKNAHIPQNVEMASAAPAPKGKRVAIPGLNHSPTTPSANA